MKNGFRVPAAPSKKDQLRAMQTELQNVQMASRISQMMLQQMMNNVKSMGEDLGSALNQLYELQYKYTALQKALNLDVNELNKIANEQRLKDFDEASAKADEKEGLEVADTASETSTVVLTSTATDENGNDRGIFRSRVVLSEAGVPDLVKELVGKKVGDKVNVTLNGVAHTVELLAIRNPTQQTQVEAAQAEATAVEASH